MTENHSETMPPQKMIITYNNVTRAQESNCLKNIEYRFQSLLYIIDIHHVKFHQMIIDLSPVEKLYFYLLI